MRKRSFSSNLHLISMKHFIATILLILPYFVFAQEKAQTDAPGYPQDYFRNPLEIPIFLAGNFGECRPGHFHSGVDIKTLGKENQPVHAAADGYISRIKMEKGGFGHGLYITHPNGYTTLYAHLNDFAPAIQQYLKKEQYAKKHWDVDIQLTPDQFPVKKGQQIAWSGNTGASTAPHLHFEIRNTKTEHPLNPELFGLPIVDKIAPVPTAIALCRNDFVFCYNDQYNNPHYTTQHDDDIIPLIKNSGNTYSLTKSNNSFTWTSNDTLYTVHGDFGIGIEVADFMDGSDNTLAFYTAKLYMDDSLQAQITLDNIGYDETRYIDAYSNYSIRKRTHRWIQCLYQLPGNHLDHIYSNLNAKKGFVNFDKGPHKILVLLTDDKGNETQIMFYATLVKWISVDGGCERMPGFRHFQANSQNIYMDSNVVFTLDDKALYEDCWFKVIKILSDSSYSAKMKVGEPDIPVHTYFDLHLKPSKTIPAGMETKVVTIYSDGDGVDGRNAVRIDNGWYRTKVRNFGTYWLDIDTIPPTIKSEQKNGANLSKAKQITFEVKDNMTSVKKFNGYLDGKWICFEQHNDLFFYKFDEHCPKGRHQLVFTAEDENGNSKDYHLNFTR